MYNYARSIVMDSSISYYGPVMLHLQVELSTWTVAHIYNTALMFLLTVHN
jgi:hypothetical protein